MKKVLFGLLLGLACTQAAAETQGKVYMFRIREDIMRSTARLAEKCLREATDQKADYVLIEMNTYGGLLDAADSIRTAILNYPRPVIVYINNQAASAGALIAIAADSVYMREGASIGAATVVGQDGMPVPDKYQSFMRSMMRATAESHGKVVDRIRGTDTTWRWRRDPLVAEAMVDPQMVVPGLSDSAQVVTLTAREALEWHFSEGTAPSVEAVLAKAGLSDYEVVEYRSTFMDSLLGFLMNPVFQGVLIMLMMGGIYFELQSPGIGFPLIVAVTAALLYFAPLYVEGLAANWEIALFVVGIILLILEIFVTPGFGLLGILGVIAMVAGLAFAMIDLSLFRYIPTGELSVGYILRPLLVVFTSMAVGLVLCFWLGPRFLRGESQLQRKVVLSTAMTTDAGYVSRQAGRGLEGRRGTVTAVLRPAGRVEIDGAYYEATAEDGMFIEKGAPVEVVRDEGGVLYCRKA